MTDAVDALSDAILSGDTEVAEAKIHTLHNNFDFYKAYNNAAKMGNLEIIEILDPILEKAERKYCDDDGSYNDVSLHDRVERINEAFRIAGKNGHDEIVEYMNKEYSGYLNNSEIFYWAKKCCLWDIMNEKITSCTKHGLIKGLARGAIGCACDNDDLDFLLYAVKKFNLNIKDYEDYIYDAAYSGNIRIVKHLVENGADLKNRGYISNRKCAALEASDRLEQMKHDLKSGKGLYSSIFKSQDELLYEINRLMLVCEYLLEVTAKRYPNLLI